MATGKTGGFLSLLASLVIFFCGTQLGLHFWPLSSLVYGIRIDYLSPTIYFLDLLIILYLFINRKFHKLVIGNWLLVILLVNLLFASNPLSTLSWSLRFLLYVLFFSTLSPRLIQNTKFIILASMLFQAMLATAQVYLGHSVGGLLYYLGERTVAVGRPAIALGSFMDSVVLRAYGTFSHPNILAGWSIVCLLIILRMTRGRSPSKLRLMTTILTAIIIFLAQSRSAALALFGLIIPFYLIKNLKSRIIYFVLILYTSYFILHTGALTRATDLSLSERLDLQGVSLKAIRQFPVFGTGAQASISTYPVVAPENRLLQPDHNSFTLFLSWFGLFGVLAILYFLLPFIIHYSLFIIPILPLLLLDHYLLTSPQGLFIFLLYLKLNYSYVQNHRQ